MGETAAERSLWSRPGVSAHERIFGVDPRRTRVGRRVPRIRHSALALVEMKPVQEPVKNRRKDEANSRKEYHPAEQGIA
jgi:hypothetical protein